MRLFAFTSSTKGGIVARFRHHRLLSDRAYFLERAQELVCIGHAEHVARALVRAVEELPQRQHG